MVQKSRLLREAHDSGEIQKSRHFLSKKVDFFSASKKVDFFPDVQKVDFLDRCELMKKCLLVRQIENVKIW